MKNLFSKLLVTLGIVASLTVVSASVSQASIAWNSKATWTGSGGKANINAYTAQTNEPWNYKIYVWAKTNDGTSKSATDNAASATDQVTVNFTTQKAVKSGTSEHTWTMSGEEGRTTKNISFPSH